MNNIADTKATIFKEYAAVVKASINKNDNKALINNLKVLQENLNDLKVELINRNEFINKIVNGSDCEFVNEVLSQIRRDSSKLFSIRKTNNRRCF